MSTFDWLVLSSTLIFIIGYGAWRTRGAGATLDSYLLGDRDASWWGVGLSIIATQASAITFLSTPGQAYDDGMRFIQFYFGLPLAMVLIALFAVPIYHRLKVFTAYEYLEGRFDRRTRTLAALLFLVQRGLSNGLSLYAPALVLSAILGWNINLTVWLLGGIMIAYTVAGGTRAVMVTQQGQVAVIFTGMVVAGYLLVHYLPPEVGFTEALQVAGHQGKLNLVDFHFDPTDRYNFWSGMTGGLFLALSYFGTDQSQVQRYLAGRSITQSRLGLLMNGLVKVPMQFGILLIGVLLFVFYQFSPPPLTFNRPVHDRVARSAEYGPQLRTLEDEHETLFLARRQATTQLVEALHSDDPAQLAAAQTHLQATNAATRGLRQQAQVLLKKAVPSAEAKDTDYVFLTFVLNYMPQGLVGLLIAVVLSAAMGSAAAGLNALASTTVIDLYRPSRPHADEAHNVEASRWAAIGWGVLGIGFATFAARLENLIQAVNILGSLFYGTILGIFMVAFFLKRVGGKAVFWSAVVAQAVVLLLFWRTDIGYLWFNIIGSGIVVGLSLLLAVVLHEEPAVQDLIEEEPPGL
ncbi:sodium:solute symporter [Microvirga sp. STR05]|uniref:Sodium:solute symporter n=1 Tax=Hymenobacter duratus TaxID=2771356 RepID=A0ABR8JIA6_9BACT|nr:sodium:solute symporter [Hymenobacter duratus]MBD2715580.1 sodium:solute symporter [Hymenobacter duratus]MBR7950488.1 sodium:solute symporter [Microvirga sp. STR05]